ncbi:MAG: hypothetical protein H6925_04440 [Holosporaceae bacterium]|nr:MAG: hypothetical protein H6925_04440 [Holosporaceae bacterium]
MLAQAHMQDREHLFAILDGVATLKNLQVLGLGHIIFDEFAIRKLAHVLAGLRQQQSRDGKTASGNDLKVLHLPGVMKGSQNLSDLARVFSGWVDLEEVNLAHNKIGSKGLHFFGELLNEVRALRVLNVADNDLFAGSGGVTRGIDALSAGILSRKDTLEALNLAGNNMRHTDLSHLEDALKACRSLRVLDLRGNQLTEKSFDLLKGLLKALPQIEQILLSGNNVSRAVYEQRLTLSQKKK